MNWLSVRTAVRTSLRSPVHTAVRTPLGATAKIGVAALVVTALVGCGSVSEAWVGESSAGELGVNVPRENEEQPGEALSGASGWGDISRTEEVTFVSVVDGDTIKTSAGNVRIVGIDTPERGECGYADASRVVADLVSPGDTVLLHLPATQRERDHYDRLIRHVETAQGVDVALRQIEAGNAIARYDSSDGYPKHGREKLYHDNQLAERTADNSVITTACGAKGVGSAETNSQVTPPTDTVENEWWQQFTSCSHLSRAGAGFPQGPFDVNNPAEKDAYNWFAFGTGHRGDGDGDGLACE